MPVVPDERLDVHRVVDGRYALSELPGDSWSGVRRARDLRLQRDVALKLFAPDADGADRHGDELSVMARLAHPGIVRLFDAGTWPTSPGVARPYLVMEHVAGSDLRLALQRGPLTGADVVSIGTGLAGALTYLHAGRIVHGGIEPTSVLLPGDGSSRVKLCGFGTAHHLDGHRHRATRTRLGDYLSPEQLLGHRAGPAGDVYSLGLVLLEILTGRRAPGPVVASTPDRGWGRLLTAMLSDDPAARPSAAQVCARIAELAPCSPALVQPAHRAATLADHATDRPARRARLPRRWTRTPQPA